MSFATCPVDFNLYSSTDSVTKYPDLRSFGHEDNSEEHAQVPLVLHPIIKKLGEYQVRGDRQTPFLHGKAAVALGIPCVSHRCSPHREIRCTRLGTSQSAVAFSLHGLECLIGCPVHISFLVTSFVFHDQSFL